VHGDRQKYLVALITLDPEEITAWAEEQGISYKNLSELAGNPKLETLIRSEVERLNHELATFENVRKFRILPVDFSIEEGELTPTLKVKRKAVNKKYERILQELYGKDWTPE
jgi:long-chain acyl-CoA synthetase